MHTYLSELQIQTEMLTLHLLKSILGQLKKKNQLPKIWLFCKAKDETLQRKKKKTTKRSTSIHG